MDIPAAAELVNLLTFTVDRAAGSELMRNLIWIRNQKRVINLRLKNTLTFAVDPAAGLKWEESGKTLAEMWLTNGNKI